MPSPHLVVWNTTPIHVSCPGEWVGMGARTCNGQPGTPPNPALTSPHPSSPTFSGFLLCHLCRLKASRAPANTCLQTRPGLLSEWVSQGGEGWGAAEGRGLPYGTGTPWWSQPAQPWSRQVGLSPFSGSPLLQIHPSLSGPKGRTGRGGLCTHSWSGPLHDAFVVGSKNSSPQSTIGHMGHREGVPTARCGPMTIHSEA